MKRLIAIAMLFSLALSFSGCTGSPASSISSSISSSSSASESISQSEAPFDPADCRLAICMGSVTHPVHRIAQLGFIEAAEELGYSKPLVSGLDEGSIDELIEKWDGDITANHVKGVVAWTGDDSLYKQMAEWHAKGIKVVVPYFKHSIDVAYEIIDANPSYDRYNWGAAAADYLVEALQEKGITEGNLGITGFRSDECSEYEGFCDRIAELHVNFQVLDMFSEGAELDAAAKRIEQYITENPAMVGAFGTTGGSAVAWSTAMENLGRQDIMVMGTFYSTQNLDVLESGGVAAIVSLPLYENCYESVYALDKLLNGETFDQSSWSMDMGFNIITANGEGQNGIQYYRDLYTRSEAIHWADYMA